MFCGIITESSPKQVPHLSQCSYGLALQGKLTSSEGVN